MNAKKMLEMNAKKKKLEMNAKKTLEAVESAAVKVVVYREAKNNEEEDERNGSGVILEKEGPYALILTCGHVIKESLENGYAILVSFSNGYVSQNFRVVTRMKEAAKEVALIFGCDKMLNKFKFNSFSDMSQVKDYSLIYCGSYPYGINQPFTVTGRVAQSYVFSETTDHAFAYEMAVGRGSSGAALIDQRQRIMGLHIEGHRSPVVRKRMIKERRGGDVVEREDEILVGFGEGVVKFGLPTSHIKDTLSEFHKYLHGNDNRIYQSCGKEGANCQLFVHFKEEEEEKERKKREEKKRKKEEKAEEKKRKKEEKRKR